MPSRLFAQKYRAISFLTRVVGTRPFVPAVMKIMFAAPFARIRRARLRESMVQGVLAKRPDRVAASGRRRDLAQAGDAGGVGPDRAPTLVISGELDSAVCPPLDADGRRDPRGEVRGVPRAGHTSSIEEPEAVNRVLREFWESLPAAALRSRDVRELLRIEHPVHRRDTLAVGVAEGGREELAGPILQHRGLPVRGGPDDT